MIRLEYGHEEREILGTFATREEANKALIDRYTKDGIKSYYWRSWMPKVGCTVVDFGSWTKFGFFYEVE